MSNPNNVNYTAQQGSNPEVNTPLSSDPTLRSTYAPLVSPALTGTPTEPTATPLSDSTTAANSKYVDDAIATQAATHTTQSGKITTMAKYSRGVRRADDKRKQYHSVEGGSFGSHGESAKRVTGVFHDRRITGKNGRTRRAS